MHQAQKPQCYQTVLVEDAQNVQDYASRQVKEECSDTQKVQQYSTRKVEEQCSGTQKSQHYTAT